MYLMKLSILLFVACASAEVEPKEENGVLVLNKDNFESTLASKKFLLVEFYAPWCGHCKDLAPKYEAAAEQLAKKNLKGVLAKIDASVERDIASKYNINGYPILKLFKDGQLEADYEDPRTTDDLVEFMVQRTDPNYKPPKPVVVTLTSTNFNTFKDENDYFLLEFFAPWCGHCKSLAPEYERAAKMLAKEDPPIPLAAVDATKEKELAEEYGVKGYPSLKLMRKGKAFDYKAEPHAEAIFEFMVRNRKDAAEPVVSVEKVQKEIPKFLPVVVGYFPDAGSALFKSFIEATNELREDFKVMLALNAEVAEHFGLQPNVLAIVQPEIIRSKFESGVTVFDQANANSSDVKTFLKAKRFPLVGYYTYDTRTFYENARQTTPVCIAFYSVDFSADHRKATQLWRTRIADVANGFKDRVIFGVASDEEQEEQFRRFGLEDTSADMNIGCTTPDGAKYAMPEMDTFDAEHITNFVQTVIDGSAKIYLKSMPIPAHQGLVKTVVGNTFAQMVTENPNDVLIEFFSPNCDACKELEPIYMNFARRLKDIKTLTLVKIDAKANDAPPPYKVERLPTLYIKPSGTKEPIKLEGPYKESSIMEALAEYLVASAPAMQQKIKKNERKEEL